MLARKVKTGWLHSQPPREAMRGVFIVDSGLNGTLHAVMLRVPSVLWSARNVTMWSREYATISVPQPRMMCWVVFAM